MIWDGGVLSPGGSPKSSMWFSDVRTNPAIYPYAPCLFHYITEWIWRATGKSSSTMACRWLMVWVDFPLVFGFSKSGWWFGTFFIFPYIGNNHPNWGVAQPPSRSCFPFLFGIFPAMARMSLAPGVQKPAKARCPPNSAAATAWPNWWATCAVAVCCRPRRGSSWICQDLWGLMGYLVANSPRIVSGWTNPGDFNGISVGARRPLISLVN